MLLDHFPLLGLRVRTPRLELRLPSPGELAALAELAAEGIHDPEVMPFLVPWTDQPAAEIARSVIQRHWSQLGSWAPQDWSLGLAVFQGDSIVGVQDISARDLASSLSRVVVSLRSVSQVSAISVHGTPRRCWVNSGVVCLLLVRAARTEVAARTMSLCRSGRLRSHSGAASRSAFSIRSATSDALCPLAR